MCMSDLRLPSVLLLLGMAAGLARGQGSGVDLGAIDRTGNPCADFYQYACGGWLKNNAIPADQSSWGRFDELFLRNQQTLRAILEDSARSQERSAIDQKIGGFYQSCMDEPGIERRGGVPLKTELERIAGLTSSADLAGEVARLHERQ